MRRQPLIRYGSGKPMPELRRVMRHVQMHYLMDHDVFGDRAMSPGASSSCRLSWAPRLEADQAKWDRHSGLCKYGRMDKGSSNEVLRSPATSLTQSIGMQQQLERKLLAEFAEIERVFARTGTAEVASDAMPPNISESYVMLKPRPQWPNPNKPREQLISEVQASAAGLPGSNYEFSQPIELRFNELISGVRSDVAVKIFGDDIEVLNASAAEVAEMLARVPGASGVNVEQTTGLPMLTVDIDHERIARYGLNMSEVQETVAVAIGGREAGTLFQGDRRFDIIVRLPEAIRGDLGAIERLPIVLPDTGGGTVNFIQLGEVATLTIHRLVRDRGRAAPA